MDLEKHLLHDIRDAANFSMPLGNDRFNAQIEHTLGRTIDHARRGKAYALIDIEN